MRYTFYFFLLMIVLSGCTQNSQSDSTDPTILIAEYGLTYEVPFPQRSIIAPKDNLTDDITLCVVDTNNNVATFLLVLPKIPEDSLQADNVVKLICTQNIPEYRTSSIGKINECTFLDYPAWHFENCVTVKSDEDSLQVMFQGYIFKNLALVVTNKVEDSDKTIDVKPYINGLKKNS